MGLVGRVLRKIFRLQIKDDPDRVAEEKWETKFRWIDENRFLSESTPKYRARRHRRSLSLELQRQSLFAWTTCTHYRYADFCLEADLAIEPDNGYSAAGLILRQLDDDNYYYFLLSNRSYFRFDLVFNGNPIRLIEWALLPAFIDFRGFDHIPLRIIARGSAFSFYLDDEWIGEVSDDSIMDGKIGFAAQNYEEKDQAHFYLRELSLTSIPVEVERAYFRWTSYVPIRPEARVNLAKAFFGQEQYESVVVQMRKALAGRRGSAEEYMLLAEALINMESYEPALQAVDQALDEDNPHDQALQEKANLLYLLNRFEEARAHLETIIEGLHDNAAVHNLLGNITTAMGDWQAAREAYQRAVEIQPEMPLFKLNLARTLDTMDLMNEAKTYYLQAAEQLFRQEAYSEVWPVIYRVKSIDPDNQENMALSGKLFYYEGKKAEAEAIFRRLLKQGFEEDSTVYFLLGLILAEKDDRQAAAELFEKACRLEPDVSLYRLRFAENLFLMGRECRSEVEEVLRLDPEDAWVNNLYGQVLMAEGKAPEALSYFERATRREPDEVDLSLNYSDCLAKSGRIEEALKVNGLMLNRHEDDARLHNQEGNLFVLAGDFPHALVSYEKALKLEGGNPDYLRNCASTCIELDMILRSEELLTRLLDLHPASETYNLVGHLELIKGEYARAEAALNEGLELEPESLDLQLNLAALCIETRRIDEARKIIQEILAASSEEAKAKRLLERIHEEFDERLECAQCGIVWWVPKDLPPQPALRLRGHPPEDCPAGRCARCGKVYCIRCAQEHLVESRFVCADCDEALRVSDDSLKYLVHEYVKEELTKGSN
jgi:tetratricopeptide (TPR) repeat protein